MARSHEGHFGVQFPYKSVSKKQRFFFFKTLQDEEADPALENTPQQLYTQARGVIAAGIDSISISPSGQQNIVKNALAFLKELANANLQDETAWVQRHITKNPHINKEMAANIQAFFKADKFEYLDFINYLNICLSGFDDYTYNLKYESERLKKLKAIWDELKALQSNDSGKYGYLKTRAVNKLRSDTSGKRKVGKKLDNDDILAQTFIEFCQQQIRDKTKDSEAYINALDSQTLINRVAGVLDSVFTTFWNSEEHKIKLMKLLEKESLDNLSREDVAFIITHVALHSLPRINEIIEETKAQKSKDANNIVQSRSETIIQEFMKQLNINESSQDGTIKATAFLNSLKEQLQNLQEDAKQIEIFRTRLFTKLKITGTDYTKDEHKKHHGGLVGLTQEAIDILVPIIKSLHIKGDERSLEQFGSAKKGKTVTQRAQVEAWLRAALRAGFSDDESNRQYLRSARYTGKTNKQIQYKDIADLANRIMGTNPNRIKTKIGAKSNFMSEMQGDMALYECLRQDKIVSALTPTNLTNSTSKRDVATLELGKVTVTPDFKDEFKKIAAELIDIAFVSPHAQKGGKKTQAQGFLRDQNGRVQAAARAITAEKKRRKEADFTGVEFFIEGETMKRIEAFEKTTQILAGLSEKETKTAKAATAALQALQNSVRIGESVKSYDKYDNERGFTGGSLGGSIEHQIKNIEYMFQQGGLSFPDKQWLLFSIYNAGNALVGSDYKEQLEQFLSIFAVALMFDDIGEQAKYIADQLAKKATQKKQFLHLFLLNGTYFPLSYVLNLVYDELCECYQIATTYTAKVTRKGGGAIINNNVSYNDATVGRSSKGLNQTTEPAQWYNTFQRNRGSVTLQVTFLAGLLDILDALNNKLNPTQ